MALHSMQRAATSAKHKTTASIKKVFYCSPLSPLESTSSGIEEREARREAEALLKAKKLDAVDDDEEEEYLSSPRSATSDSDFSDEDGYFTANDGQEDSDSSDFETDSDEKRHSSGLGADAAASHDSSSSLDGLDSPSKFDFTQNTGSEIGFPNGYGSTRSARFDVESASSQIQKLRPSIDKLRAAVQELESEDVVKQVEDATWVRFLIARNCAIAKSADMFVKDWRWRREFAGNGIPAESISYQLGSEKAFLQGIDRQGRPLLILAGSRHVAKRGGLEEFRRYCYFCIEKVLQCLPKGKDKFVTIIDLDRTSYKNMDIGGTKMMVNMLQAHYPERMGQLFVLHASAMIQMPYKLVEPAIDVKTREKIIFWGSEGIDTLLLEHIGEEILPTTYGGKADFIPLQYAKVDSARYPSRAVRDPELTSDP